jgi:hypothetical protein
MNDGLKHIQILSFPEGTNIVQKDIRNYDLVAQEGEKFILTDGTKKKLASVIKVDDTLVIFQLEA